MKFADQQLSFLAILLSVFFAVIGLYYFFSQFEYFEVGQLVLMALFVLCNVMFFFWFKERRIVYASLMIGMMFLVIAAANKKYEWRENYVTKGFELELYIDQYPSWEEYLYARVMEEPNWVDFVNTCVKPSQRGRRASAPAHCGNLRAIEQTYHIDMGEELQKHFQKMKKTAKAIANERVRQIGYPRCILSKTCAQVPLLPKGVDPDSVNPESMDYIEIRRAFWDLVEGSQVTAEICGHMELCRVLRDLGAINPEKSG